MALWILTDAGQERSVLYDSVTEIALPCPGFIGDECAEQAEDFIEFCDGDPRRLDKRELEVNYADWAREAFNEHDEFIGTKGEEQ